MRSVTKCALYCKESVTRQRFSVVATRKGNNRQKVPQKSSEYVTESSKTILHRLAKFEMFYTNFALVWFGKCMVLVI